MDERSEFHREKVADFKALVGIDGLAGRDATDGVLADWRELTPILSEDLRGLRFLGYDASPLKSGIGEANWDWKRREDGISVEVYVCGTGAAGARARLIEKATNTTTVKSHMAPALEKVGELAVEHESHDGDDILWVFRNVCVSVCKFGRGPKVISVARRIQSFLAAHLVSNLAARVPRIAKIEVSKNPIRVGDTFEVRVVLPSDLRLRDHTIEIRPASWPMLDPIEYGETSVVFRATDPGPAELDVIVLDPVTLLSPRAGVVIDVLPAP
jgi:hypothetical protein